MVRVRIHYAQQDLANNATTQRPETLAAAKFSNPQQLRFAQQVIPEWSFLVQAARAEKTVIVTIETHLLVAERR